jgi:hypothetical protein
MNHLTADKLPVVKAILSFAVTAVLCSPYECNRAWSPDSALVSIQRRSDVFHVLEIHDDCRSSEEVRSSTGQYGLLTVQYERVQLVPAGGSIVAHHRTKD